MNSSLSVAILELMRSLRDEQFEFLVYLGFLLKEFEGRRNTVEAIVKSTREVERFVYVSRVVGRVVPFGSASSSSLSLMTLINSRPYSVDEFFFGNERAS